MIVCACWRFGWLLACSLLVECWFCGCFAASFSLVCWIALLLVVALTYSLCFGLL